MRVRPLSLLIAIGLLAVLLGGSIATGASGATADRETDRSAPVDAMAPTAGKLRTVALGVSMWPGRSLAELDAFTASIGGRTPATWSIWSQWGDPSTREFATAVAKGVKERKATPIIW